MAGRRTITLEDGRTVTIKDGRKSSDLLNNQDNVKTMVQEDFQFTGQSTDKTMVLGEEPKLDAPLAWLIEKRGPRIGMTHRLTGVITSIGRDASNNISLSDESVSAYHAKIRIEDNKYVLYDLVSENGTELNGEKIVYKEVKENDEIKLGEIALIFKKID